MRVVLANGINSVATAFAIQHFLTAKWRGEPLRWLKTAHEYPSPQNMVPALRHRLGEVLLLNGYISADQLGVALRTGRSGVRLGERLIELGYLTEAALYEALSLQAGLPQADIQPADVPLRTARCLPAHLTRQLRMVPVKAEAGELDARRAGHSDG